jgi:hypothetical protein
MPKGKHVVDVSLLFIRVTIAKFKRYQIFLSRTGKSEMPMSRLRRGVTKLSPWLSHKHGYLHEYAVINYQSLSFIMRLGTSTNV